MHASRLPDLTRFIACGKGRQVCARARARSGEFEWYPGEFDLTPSLCKGRPDRVCLSTHKAYNLYLYMYPCKGLQRCMTSLPSPPHSGGIYWAPAAPRPRRLIEIFRSELICGTALSGGKRVRDDEGKRAQACASVGKRGQAQACARRQLDARPARPELKEGARPRPEWLK